jgi:tartrate-resistant acid phosphatase type 5
MPALYYSFERTIPSTNETVLFVMFDAVTLVGASDDADVGPPGSIGGGGAGEVSAAGRVRGAAELAASETQLAWITETIASSSADWVVAASHYPVYSAAEHGSTPFLVEKVQPLLAKFGVALYLNGHDHNCQAVQHEGTTYLTLGACNFIKQSDKHLHTVPDGALKFQWPTAGEQVSGCFGTIEFAPGGALTTSIVATDGEVLWTATSANPRVKR